MARERLQGIWERRDAKEREIDENLKNMRIQRIADAQRNLDLLLSAEKSKSEKLFLNLEQQTSQKVDEIKNFFADSEQEWLDFIVSESVAV